MAKKAEKSASQEPQSKLLLASVVAQRVEIKDIRLVETLAKQTLGVRPGESVNISHGATTETSDEGHNVLVLARFQAIAGAAESDDPSSPALLIQATFAITYAIASTDGINKQHFDAFGELNGVYNAWPYWREFVQQITSRMGLPTLTVPVFQPTRKGTNTEKKSKIESEPEPTPKRKKKAKSKS